VVLCYSDRSDRSDRIDRIAFSDEPGPVVLCYSDLIDRSDRIDRIAFRETQGWWSFATVIDLITLIELLLERPRARGPLLQ
jgi:hypothetical protein